MGQNAQHSFALLSGHLVLTFMLILQVMQNGHIAAVTIYQPPQALNKDTL
jgi:hypothetical protein